MTARHLWLAAALLALFHSTGVSADLAETIEQAVDERKLLSAVVMTRSADQEEVLAFGSRQADEAEPPDSQTAYQIGSITKAFTHLLLAEMVQRGEVDYSTTLAEILGNEFSFANPDVGAITLEALATHSSGLPRLPANLGATDLSDPYSSFDEAMLLQAVSSARALQPLGNHYGYSNFGAGLLGYLLGRIHGGGYQAAMTELVLAPLGMTRTGFAPEGAMASAFSGGETIPVWSFDALAGAGALWSDAQDLMRLAAFAMNNDQWPLEQSIDAQRQMLDVGAGEFTLTPVWHTVETASGRVYWHNGATAGHRSFLGFRPETDESIVLLFSGDLDPTPLGMEWFGPQVSSEDEATDISDENFSRLLGQYQLTPTLGIGIFEQSSVLLAQVSGQTPAQLFPVGDQVFALHIADASLRFVEEDGSITAVELIQNGMVQRAERVADQAAVLAREETSLSADQLDAYVGEYQLGPAMRFTIRQKDGRLEAQLTGQGSYPIYAKGEDVFFYKVVDAELHFQRDDNGVIVGLVLHQAGRELPAKRL